MQRTAKKIIAAAAIAAVSIQSVPVASACGGRGGRVSYAPVYGGYARAASNYRTTLPATPPLYNTRTVYNHSVQSAPVARPASTVAAVQPRPRDQVAIQTAASTGQTVVAKPLAQPAATNPVAAQPAATKAAVTQAAAAQDAESSALAALASLAVAPQPVAAQPAASQPASAPVAASNTTAPHLGVFTATLPSNVTIELQLNSGNTFAWIVRNNGKTTQFSGQYRIAEDRLILVRSTDLQQMAGKLTTGQNGFTFKLDGSNNGGLDFKRV